MHVMQTVPIPAFTFKRANSKNVKLPTTNVAYPNNIDKCRNRRSQAISDQRVKTLNQLAN